MLLAILLTASCKKSGKAKPVEPHVSAFAPLPAGPAPVLDDAATQPVFPREPPVVVIWRGGGDPPRTELGIRVWKNGRVRYTCGRGAMVAPERVAAMVDAFTRAGWNPATAKAAQVAPDPACISTSVQLSVATGPNDQPNDQQHAQRIDRRDSGCGPVPHEIQDAVEFVQSVVGPAPC